MDNHWLAEWCNYWAYARWVHARLFRQRNQSFSVAGLLSNCFILINLLHKRSFPKIETANVLESLGDGFRFIWKTKIVLWAISLDLASVLLVV